jgi:hypothetical protein
MIYTALQIAKKRVLLSSPCKQKSDFINCTASPYKYK